MAATGAKTSSDCSTSSSSIRQGRSRNTWRTRRFWSRDHTIRKAAPSRSPILRRGSGSMAGCSARWWSFARYAASLEILAFGSSCGRRGTTAASGRARRSEAITSDIMAAR